MSRPVEKKVSVYGRWTNSLRLKHDVDTESCGQLAMRRCIYWAQERAALESLMNAWMDAGCPEGIEVPREKVSIGRRKLRVVQGGGNRSPRRKLVRKDPHEDPHWFGKVHCELTGQDWTEEYVFAPERVDPWELRVDFPPDPYEGDPHAPRPQIAFFEPTEQQKYENRIKTARPPLGEVGGLVYRSATMKRKYDGKYWRWFREKNPETGKLLPWDYSEEYCPEHDKDVVDDEDE